MHNENVVLPIVGIVGFHHTPSFWVFSTLEFLVTIGCIDVMSCYM